MTSPGQPQPPDTITVGSRYTQDITEANVQAMAKGGFNSQFTGLGLDWKSFLAGIVQQVEAVVQDLIQGLVDGATVVGGVVLGTIETIVDGFVNLVRNLAGAILGGGTRAQEAGLPDTFTGDLAAVADGQREILDAALLEDNPGYGNACSTYNVTRTATTTGGSGTANLWVPQRFDEPLGPPKNCTLMHGTIRHPISTGPEREFENQLSVWKFDAPGVWRIFGQLTVQGDDSSVVNIHAELRVHDLYLTPEGGLYAHSNLGIFSKSFFATRLDRGAGQTGFAETQTLNFNKPVIIPEITEPVAGTLITDHGYTWIGLGCSMWSRHGIYDTGEFTTLGGASFSSFNVQRMSTDTTDYNAPDLAEGTVTL